MSVVGTWCISCGLLALNNNQAVHRGLYTGQSLTWKVQRGSSPDLMAGKPAWMDVCTMIPKTARITTTPNVAAASSCTTGQMCWAKSSLGLWCSHLHGAAQLMQCTLQALQSKAAGVVETWEACLPERCGAMLLAST